MNGMHTQVDGPAYTSRALAIIHVAVWDAYVGISRDAPTYDSYDSLPEVEDGASSGKAQLNWHSSVPAMA
jgi:hypothetical protein